MTSHMDQLIDQPEFRRWIDRCLARRENVLAVSNQGTVLRYEGDGLQAIVKTAMGRGPVRRIRERTLLREHEAYRRMSGLAGIPECYGMIDGRFLVLEYVRGVPYREATWVDRDRWFARLLDVILAFHARGVSHGDLKSKTNILVTQDEKPCIIDFGTSFIHRDGFHPVNNRLHEHGKRMDLNAWVKHKYHGHYSNVSEADAQWLDYSFVEYWVRRLRGRPMDRVRRTR
jgi:predicted Ser/Thr protein kinase